MELEVDQDLEKNLRWLGVTAVLTVVVIGLGNIHSSVPEEQVGFTDVYTECTGLDVGVCLGIERVQHNTVNYDDYQSPEEGSENYYRLVESELMAQAYNICDEDTEDMEWISEAEFDNRTGDEWIEDDRVNLLPCDQVTWRPVRYSSN